jgi:hypothetical protein
MGRWIGGLDPPLQEAARVLRWGAIVAMGRTISLETQSDARRLSQGRCYTFQPAMVAIARRVGEIRDFSAGTEEPLADRPGRDRPEGDSGP